MESVPTPSPPQNQLELLQRGDSADADQARERLAAGKRRSGLFTALRSHSPDPHRPRVKGKSKGTPRKQPELITTTSDVITIQLESSSVSSDEQDGPNKDVYRWATLYENQRGITMFSMPYYSRMTLLPTDPLAFTTPESASQPRSHQPVVSLNEYPLPDGNWVWVSSTWLIDMRAGTGEVNYDGFEYNWAFRREGWRSEVGRISAGGWVRRRRWIRLMMRPGKKPLHVDLTPDNTPYGSPMQGTPNKRMSTGTGHLSVPPSITAPSLSRNPVDLDEAAAEVWQGVDADENWVRCHDLMKRVVRDGRKLELWKGWLAAQLKDSPNPTHPGLGHHAPIPHPARDRDPTRDTYGMDKWKPYESPHTYYDERREVWKGKQKQWTEDSQYMPSELAAHELQAVEEQTALRHDIEAIKAVLHTHGNTLLHSFVYPDSRAQFLTLLGRAGLLPELNVGLADEVDFWSYASDLSKTGLDIGSAVLTAPNSRASSLAPLSGRDTPTLKGRPPSVSVPGNFAPSGSAPKENAERLNAQVMMQTIVHDNAAAEGITQEHDRAAQGGDILQDGEKLTVGEIKMSREV